MKGLLRALMIATLVHGVASAQQPPPSAPSSALVPLPPGPFSTWPDDLKRKALVSLAFRCNMVSVMALGNYRGPEMAAKEYAKSLAAACVDRQMPDDWPGHDETRKTVLRHFNLAHEQDPTLEMPQWPPSKTGK
jgi:hypothetical protein